MTKPSLIKEMRRILEGLLRVIAGASQIAIDRNADSGVIEFKEPIDKTALSLLKLWKGMLGEENEQRGIGDESHDGVHSWRWINGANAYRASLLKLIEDAERGVKG